MSELNAALVAVLQQLQAKTNRELKEMFHGMNTYNPTYGWWNHQYNRSIYDEYRYNNQFNNHPTTPTKEKPPVTSSTLNDMTVAELEALAERTANTLKEKKAQNTIKFGTEWESYHFNKLTGELTLAHGGRSAYQPIVKAFLDAKFSDTKGAITSLNTIFTAITPTK